MPFRSWSYLIFKPTVVCVCVCGVHMCVRVWKDHVKKDNGRRRAACESLNDCSVIFTLLSQLWAEDPSQPLWFWTRPCGLFWSVSTARGWNISRDLKCACVVWLHSGLQLISMKRAPTAMRHMRNRPDSYLCPAAKAGSLRAWGRVAPADMWTHEHENTCLQRWAPTFGLACYAVLPRELLTTTLCMHPANRVVRTLCLSISVFSVNPVSSMPVAWLSQTSFW